MILKGSEVSPKNTYTYIYIYIYRERERERVRLQCYGPFLRLQISNGRSDRSKYFSNKNLVNLKPL
jgi:hypothetical protein